MPARWRKYSQRVQWIAFLRGTTEKKAQIRAIQERPCPIL